MRVKISKIRIKRRIRKDLGNIESLKDSMRKSGLINPITVTDKFELIAGYRRLLAAKELGWNDIECHVIRAKSRKDKFHIEVDENLTRKDFTSEELMQIDEERMYLESSGLRRLLLFLKRLIRLFVEWVKIQFERFRR